MEAGPLSVQKIFGQDRRLLVPLYQRPYVWNREDQWEAFWGDVRFVADRLLRNETSRPHFMGAVVLDQVSNPTGHLETRLVIDGQQRLTTIQILLEAFGDICVSYGIKKYDKALLKLTRNDDPMSVDDDDRFKIWPTNADRDHFRRVMLAEGPQEVCALYGKKGIRQEVGHPIADAYLFFYAQIEDWLTQEEGDLQDRVASLYSTLREQLRMVFIDLGAEDDAQVIFETLNARGTPLLPSDLIKNHLFHQAGPDPKRLEQLYNDYWAAFDEESSYWRKEEGRGHAKRARIDTYMQHFLSLASKDEVSVAHLYKSFLDQSRDPATGTAEDWLAELSRYAGVFRGFDQAKPGSRKQIFFERLRAMDVTTALPLLMGLYADHSEESPTVKQVLGDLESFLVRRMICQLSTRGYNRFFTDLLEALVPTDEPIETKVRQKLLASQAEASRWPDDREFLQSWNSVPVYRVLLRKRVRMVLEALVRHMHSEKTETLHFGEQLTIEHLLPQKWRAHWPIPEKEGFSKAVEKREGVLHTLGNLTLLTKRLNPAISNGPWDKKKKEILKFSALAMNQTLSEVDVWDEETILNRGRLLGKVATRIWPRPKT